MKRRMMTIYHLLLQGAVNHNPVQLYTKQHLPILEATTSVHYQSNAKAMSYVFIARGVHT